MPQTLVNIRMDTELKKEVESICRELGMSMTTAFTIFARKMAREKRIPFDVSIDPFYSRGNLDALDASIKQMERGQTVTKTFEDLEAMAR